MKLDFSKCKTKEDVEAVFKVSGLKKQIKVIKEAVK